VGALTEAVITAIVAQMVVDVPAVAWAEYGDAEAYESVKKLLPYGFVHELPGIDNTTHQTGIGYFPTTYMMGVTVLVTEGVVFYPSPADAAVKTQIYSIRDAIYNSLAANPQFSGAVELAGSDAGLFLHFVGPIPYDEQAFMGVHFELPVMV
jgi:hypothetical protein